MELDEEVADDLLYKAMVHNLTKASFNLHKFYWNPIGQDFCREISFRGLVPIIHISKEKKYELIPNDISFPIPMLYLFISFGIHDISHTIAFLFL